MIDNTEPSDQHEWPFKKTSLQSFFKLDIKNEKYQWIKNIVFKLFLNLSYLKRFLFVSVENELSFVLVVVVPGKKTKLNYIM